MEDNNINNIKLKRTEAMIRAQKKYYNRIKNEFPEKFKERSRIYAKRQYDKNKDDPDFMQRNRDNVSKYYYNNKELVSDKRKVYYKENKEKILSRQKIWRDNKKLKLKELELKELEKDDEK